MSNKAKLTIALLGFLIGYIVVSFFIWQTGFVLKYFPVAATSTAVYNQPQYDIEKASFLRVLNPFIYTLNPAMYLFIPQ